MNATADALMGIFGMKQVKPKTCKACRQKFVPARPLQTACSPACAIETIARAKAKKAEEARKTERKQDLERKERMKRRGDYLKEAQAAFNAWVRLRDQLAGHPCISSGRPLDWSGNAVDAGHYRSVGSAPHLRFHPDNCHAQSKKDNRYGAGNAVDYRIGLIARIGLERVEALEADNANRKYTIPELIALRDEYKRKARELNKQRKDAL